MKKALALLLILAITPLFAKTPWDGPPSTWEWVQDEAIKTVTHHTLKSPSMGFEIGFNVYLPPSYHTDKDRRFPVVYYLHGAGGSEKSANEFSWEVQGAIRDNEISETIYVFPNGGTFSRYRDWESENVKTETFIIDELIPHIDKTYRTIDDRKGRALAGFSMGGDGSIRFLFKYPEKFGAVSAMGAAIDWKKKGMEGDSCFDLAKQNADQLRGKFRLLMVIGEDDRGVGVNRKFHEHLKALGLESTLITHPGVGHNLGVLKEKSGRKVAVNIDQWFQKKS